MPERPENLQNMPPGLEVSKIAKKCSKMALFTRLDE